MDAGTPGGGPRGRGLDGAERRHGACAGPPSKLDPRPEPPPPTHPRLPPRPSAASLTSSLRLESAPALSSDPTQGVRPQLAA